LTLDRRRDCDAPPPSPARLHRCIVEDARDEIRYQNGVRPSFDIRASMRETCRTRNQVQLSLTLHPGSTQPRRRLARSAPTFARRLPRPPAPPGTSGRMFRAGSALLLIACLACATTARASIVVVNGDGEDEGFNDDSPRAPVGGNPGTTLGQQRYNVFQRAAEIWEQVIDAGVDIHVRATFDSLFCGMNVAVLGSAGAVSFFRDFTSAPRPATWYPAALANKLAGADLDPEAAEISAQFNSAVGTTCPFPFDWYYGLDGDVDDDQIDLLTVVVHEIAHGLGFATIVQLATGVKGAGTGFDDAFMLFLEDHSTTKLYPNMTDAERVTASKDTGDLHWVGPGVVAGGVHLFAGRHDPSGHVRMFAPDPQLAGSSVSHFDAVLAPNELLEPAYVGPNHDVGLAEDALEDIGWAAAAQTTTTTASVSSTSTLSPSTTMSPPTSSTLATVTTLGPTTTEIPVTTSTLATTTTTGPAPTTSTLATTTTGLMVTTSTFATTTTGQVATTSTLATTTTGLMVTTSTFATTTTVAAPTTTTLPPTTLPPVTTTLPPPTTTVPVPTTSTTIATTTTTTVAAPTTTSTTIIPPPVCGDASGDGEITARDALLVLRTAIAASTCAACVCDVNESGSVNATDALAVLRASVGLGKPLDCPAC
jgi:Dockerin type I domain